MSDANHKLHRETQAARVLRENLADLIGGDEETAADFVEGETNLNEAIDAAVTRMLADEVALTGIDFIVTRLEGRRNRLKTRIANTKTALLAALEQAGKKRHEHAAVTLSIKSTPPSVIVTDEALIPSQYWTPGEPKLSKKAVGDALKAKTDVPGASLSNGGTTLQASWP